MSVYLDNNATTRLSEAALAAMLPYLRERYGNPSSLHGLGAQAARALAEARAALAAGLGATPEQVVFTSGGSEANALALRGAARTLRKRGDHVVSTQVEHPSVEACLQLLEEEGFRVTRLRVHPEQGIALADLLGALEKRTVLLSLMHVQNETGHVFPVELFARRAKQVRKRLWVHVDGVQALGKLPPPGPEVDLYAVSAHKIHGPKGVGALRVGAQVHLPALIPGGGQERGLRSGTENLPGIVGFGVALGEALAARAALRPRLAELGGRLAAGIEALGGVLNGPAAGWPGTVNASFPGRAAEPLLHALEARGVYASTGAACASRKRQRSRVLSALGLPPERLDSALRFSLSRETRAAEIELALQALEEVLAASPA